MLIGREKEKQALLNALKKSTLNFAMYRRQRHSHSIMVTTDSLTRDIILRCYRFLNLCNVNNDIALY